MSKPTSYNVSPYDFERAFGFYPCNCHRIVGKAPLYTILYRTQPFSSIITHIDVTCNSCGTSFTRDISSMNIDGDSLPF